SPDDATVMLHRPVFPSQLMYKIGQTQKAQAGAPHQQGELPSIPVPVVDRTEPPLRGLRVLLVDDNELNRIVAQAFLTQGGATVVLAVSGGDAIRVAAQQSFDVVLMDIQMPDMDGYQAGREILKQHPTLPLIALTANAMVQDHERSAKEGFTDHLIKPLTRSSLYRALAKLVTAQPHPETPPAAPQDCLLATLTELGVDTATGIAFAGDDVELYHRILDRLAVGENDLVAPLRQARATGEIDTATRMAHTMKSLMKLIGAHGPADLATQVEMALRHGTPVNDTTVAALCAQYTQIRQAIMQATR
ncbi:MAG: Hpt domain-containing response regulator, partial [Paracoccaceae bacterium]